MIPILFEDRDLTVCVKPAGVVSEGEGLPAMLETQLKGKFFCVHRLDRETAGVMVLARNEKTAAALSRAFSAHETRKIYLALAEGQTESESGEMRDLLYHDRQRNKTYVVDRRRAGVHEAALRWEMIRTGYLENAEGKPVPVTLYRVALETGRTHQIRVQFASRGMPLVGDRKYGSHIRTKDLMLFAAELSFTHPATGKSMRFAAQSDWPEAADSGEINVKE